MNRRAVLISPLAVMLFALPAALRAADWPMWRCDPGRTACVDETLPGELQLRWVRQLPALRPAFVGSARLGFDRGYEPVVAGKTLLVASSRTDCVTAYDTETGSLRWRFFADGPVRFAPVVHDGTVLFGSDDGCLHSLDLATGQRRWRFRAVPSRRVVLGNRRLVSVWPVRGGPVASAGRVYFAAGVWPMEGTFVYALDTDTGKVIWRNDRTGHVYGAQPHGAEGFSGLSPQGYLVASGDDLVVPCGTAYPARFDLATGVLREFTLPKRSRYPGGWFVQAGTEEAKDRRRGRIVTDVAINTERHEDKVMVGSGEPGLLSTIRVGDRTLTLNEQLPGVAGEVHSLAAADGKLFVVTLDGSIWCLGEAPDFVKRYRAPGLPRPRVPAVVAESVERLITGARARRGHALVLGAGDGRLVDHLLAQTQMRVVVLDPDPRRVEGLRRNLVQSGLHGERASAIAASSSDLELPPYLARLVVCEDPQAAGFAGAAELVESMLPVLRPFGGVLALRGEDTVSAAVREVVRASTVAGLALDTAGEWTIVRREGPIPGSADYTGGWTSADELVRAPLGVLWFDDTLGHFKRSPQPQFIAGVMVSRPKKWLGPRTHKGGGYHLDARVFSDMYTGRVLGSAEVRVVIDQLGEARDKQQPIQYRPPYQKDDWKPEPAVAGGRMNPITGLPEPRAIPKSYGCDGGVDYGGLYTLRSATAAFYDKTTESGTVNISGPRSGCTNSIVPAGGILNVPYFYEGCTCSYPLPSGLALVSMPETYEQWAAFGVGEPGPVLRVGLNLGAPGDRTTRDGTLWLDVPGGRGESPAIDVTVKPSEGAELRYFYSHSLWIEGGHGWPWVAASGVEGVGSLTLRGVAPGAYTVRLFFGEPGKAAVGERLIDVQLQGAGVIEALDVVKEAGGARRALVRELRDVKVDGELRIELAARKGRTLLCGVELISSSLPAGDVPVLPERTTALLTR